MYNKKNFILTCLLHKRLCGTHPVHFLFLSNWMNATSYLCAKFTNQAKLRIAIQIMKPKLQLQMNIIEDQYSNKQTWKKQPNQLSFNPLFLSPPLYRNTVSDIFQVWVLSEHPARRVWRSFCPSKHDPPETTGFCDTPRVLWWNFVLMPECNRHGIIRPTN